MKMASASTNPLTPEEQQLIRELQGNMQASLVRAAQTLNALMTQTGRFSSEYNKILTKLNNGNYNISQHQAQLYHISATEINLMDRVCAEIQALSGYPDEFVMQIQRQTRDSLEASFDEVQSIIAQQQVLIESSQGK